MKNKIGIATLLLATALSTAPLAAARTPQQQSTAATANGATADDFIQREKASWESWKAKNASVFQQELASDYKAQTDAGLKDKQDAVSAVQNVELESYSLSDFNVTFPDDNTAVVTYRADFSGRNANGPFHAVRDIRSTWSRQGNDWVVTAYQGTSVQ